MKRYLNKLWERCKALVLGLKCDRCGKRPASLVIHAEKTGKSVHNGVKVKTYAVRGCRCECAECKARTKVML